jgi:ribosomal protein S18 acetylase RimI-like enzyme
MGIYEDLRNRLNSKAPHQIFLVAVPYLPIASAQRLAHANLPGTPLAGTVEISQRSFSFWEQQRTRHLYLSNLAVPAEYRRQGVARQLLATCDRIAAEWGIPDLYLHVLENNYPARQLYFKAGYRLHRVDASIGSWLLGQPRQLFLHKRVPLNECAGCQGSDCV